MIIRILGEGQYEIEAEPMSRINALDERMFQAVVDRNAGEFRSLLDQVLAIVRDEGQALEVEDLRPSELALPAADSTMEEVRDLFAQEGLLRTS